MRRTSERPSLRLVGRPEEGDRRWQSSEFDALFRAAEAELDSVKRAALFIQMNDLVVRDGYVLPVIDRMTARALTHRLVAPLCGWRSDMASLPYWYRKA